ncbi:MAG TPA: DUF427 domain-containing protein [Solirubrobacteraceae bacterium]|jgi:uncharacterized protein (DUF427 family)|nr:DUF427 domain-containing protein [Solirubrobacteraceae bacterium]
MATTVEQRAKADGIRTEHGAKRVRTYLGGEPVADTTKPLLVWEVPYYPTYYFPATDVRMDLLEADGTVELSPGLGAARTFTVRAGAKLAPEAARRYADSPLEQLRDMVRFEWAAMDAWFEEDEEVFTHARDPHTRIEILASSRHVRVEVDGVTVAESTSPHLLLETGLPARYYLPKTHVRLDLLEPSETVTHCPYKGQARTWSLRVGEQFHEDVAWSYPTPLPESQKIAGLIAFYPQKVDLLVDAVPLRARA